MNFKLFNYHGQYHLLTSEGRVIIMTKQETREYLLNYYSLNDEKAVLKNTPEVVGGYNGDLIATLDDSFNLVICNGQLFHSIMIPDADEFPFLTAAQFGEKHSRKMGIVQRDCRKGRIEGAFQIGTTWLIPKDAPYPEDRRAGRDMSSRYKKKSDE